MAIEAREHQESMKTPEGKQRSINSKAKDLSLEYPSPRGVLEAPALVHDSDTSFSSIESPEKPAALRKIPTHGIPWNKMIDSIKKKSMRRFSVIPLLATYDYTRKNFRRKKTNPQSTDSSVNSGSSSIWKKQSWRNFTYEELAAASGNFDPEKMIGKGGHAEVYRGQLQDGQMVAIKKIMRPAKEEEEKVSDFLSELGIIAHVDHPNAAGLMGFSTDRGLYFVLEFSSNGSLASMLFGSKERLEWEKRFKIAIGVADGLCYLHHECPRRIIHRDIKASNVLLTQDYEAQISDFGLAKWLPEGWTHHVVFPIEGTFGYLAPEYFMHGIVDEKTDVFAFGVLLLELITGRRAVDTASRQSLVMWAKPFLEKNSIAELVDPCLNGEFDPIEMKRAMLVAAICIHHLASMRPQMSRVVRILRNEDSPTELQQKSSARRTVILDGCDMQDYTRTTYLKDLNRHMQLVME